MSTDKHLPSPKVALNFQLPDDHWLEAVSMGKPKAGEPSVYVADSLHLVNGEGKLVCDCHVTPQEFKIWKAAGIQPEFRYLYCQESVTYLRKIVQRLMRKEVQQ